MKPADFMPWTHGPAVFRRLGRNYLVGSIAAVALAIVVVLLCEPLGVHREL